MNIEKSILLEIFKDISFSAEEVTIIESKFEKLHLKKNAILLNADELVTYQYYVYSGCLRTYFIDKPGKEHTLQFAINDWWISDYTAFFSTTKALMNIETILDATLYKISKKDMEGLYSEIPKLETFFRKKMEKAFASFQKRILASLAQSAKERYVSFVTTYPNIEQSVKNYHIASYLGITTESLSRIRKELAHE
jgi:CRP-like cAMP-binding protein